MDSVSIIYNAVSELPYPALEFLLDQLNRAQQEKIFTASRPYNLEQALKLLRSKKRKLSYSQKNFIVGTIAYNIGFFMPLAVMDVLCRADPAEAISRIYDYLIQLPDLLSVKKE